MAPSVSLRKSLRKIPAFRSLPGPKLEEIIDRMSCKEYKPGDVLWRTSTQTDFLGVIQRGEMVIEYQLNGVVIRSVRLTAGDLVLPRNLVSGHSIVIARAITEVSLYILRMDQINTLQSIWSGTGTDPNPEQKDQPALWNRAWLALVTVMLIFLSWKDIARIVSGSLYLASKPAAPFVDDVQGALTLLEYAKFLDQDAVFAHNREGYIWFQNNDLQKAGTAFDEAIEINPNHGASLNNFAVALFSTEQSSQAASYLQRAVETDPDSAIVKYNLGIVLMQQNRSDEALRKFREASFIEPSWVLPYIQQGFIFLQTGENARAEQAAQHAIALDSEQQSAHLICAIALFNQDKNLEALKSIEYALKINPDDFIPRFYQAMILNGLGENEAALSILEQLLQSVNDPLIKTRISAEIESIQRSLQNIPVAAH